MLDRILTEVPDPYTVKSLLITWCYVNRMQKELILMHM